jgi:ABC-type Fe3+ transport system permease subunit
MRNEQMSDRQIGDSLLKLDLSPRPEISGDQIQRVIDTDRRGVKRWLRITVVLWCLAALGAIALFIIGGLAFPVIAKMLAERGEGSLEQPDTPFLVLTKLLAMSFVLGTASAVTLVAAGLTTVILMARSRTATLRQINANLLMISNRLKTGEGKTAK